MATMTEVAAYYPGLALAASEAEEGRADNTWIDGPGLVKWLEARNIGRGDESVRWRIRRWRRGGLANYATVDRVLCGTDYTLDDIPDELWGGCKRNSKRFTSTERRAAAEDYWFAEHRDWITRAEVARKYGISVHTLHTWVCKYRRGEL